MHDPWDFGAEDEDSPSFGPAPEDEVPRVHWLYLQVLRERILDGTYLSERRLRTALERMVALELLEEGISGGEPRALSAPPPSPR